MNACEWQECGLIWSRPALRGCYLSIRWMWVISGVRDDIRSAFRLEFTMPSVWYNPSGDSSALLTLSESRLPGNSMKTLLQLKHVGFESCDRAGWNVKPPQARLLNMCHVTCLWAALTAERTQSELCFRPGIIWTLTAFRARFVQICSFI